MKALFGRPGFLSPYGSLGADLSFLLAVSFTGLFMLGWYKAKKGEGQSHHLITLTGMVAMLAYFTVYYLARGLGSVALQGKEGFGGGESIYTWVFSPILTVHIWVVSGGIFLALYMILLGYRVSLKQGGRRILVPGSPALAMKPFSLWTLSISVLLFLVLFLIRTRYKSPSFTLFIVWFSLCVGGGLILILMEWFFKRFWPDGEKRHRFIGRITMFLYLIALITSTTTYLMLYVFWPPVPVH